MAITRKQAKIFALRWQLDNLDSKPDLDTSRFTPYEAEKIYQEMDKLAEALHDRLMRLGDNPSIRPWDSELVRSNRS